MSVFEKIYLRDGTSYHRAESKTYRLKDIADYLHDCMEAPQNDTKVRFAIRDNGEVYISTFNDECAGEIEARFKAIE